MKTLSDVAAYLKKAGTYYLATDDRGQPRVRPFGTAHIFEGALYIQTGKRKDVSRQIHANGRIAICASDALEPMVFTSRLSSCTRKSSFLPTGSCNAAAARIWAMWLSSRTSSSSMAARSAKIATSVAKRTTLSLSLTVSDKKALKMMAAERETTIAAIIHEWVAEHLEK